mmetsp:Transcript_28548/g.81642  ORF Transcript_28548/g.81642 Transcript_28548/m.81642 type:complete len:262 (-) Transcript_28548:80-865(-)
MGKGREERGGTRKEVPALGGGASTWSRRYITHKGAISPGSETTHSSAGSASPPIGNDQAIRGRVGGVQRECAARARLPLAEKETPRRPTWPPRLEGARLRRDMRKPSLTEAPRASARLQPAPTLGRLRGGVRGGDLLGDVAQRLARCTFAPRLPGIGGIAYRLTERNGAALRRRDRPAFKAVEDTGEAPHVLHIGQVDVRIAQALLGTNIQGKMHEVVESSESLLLHLLDQHAARQVRRQVAHERRSVLLKNARHLCGARS